MVGRALASLLMLVMLNAAALGDGLFSLRGSPCDPAAASAGMAHMAGMGTDGMKMPAGTNHPGEPAGGCSLPWAPGCATVAPCAPTADVVETAPLVAAGLRSFRVSVAETRAPESPAIAPDLPPPRI